jgi:hypothetical protein
MKIVKHGVKTSEFYITLITVLGSALAGLEGILEPKYAAVVSLVSAAIYTFSRVLVKKESDE